MGCLNSDENFEHWFGNIHLSGPCNRSCYFCIGQHMMALDALNNLGTWPLLGISQFSDEIERRAIKEVNLTGTNTDPLLYVPMKELVTYFKVNHPGVKLGLRTNGALAMARSEVWRMFDKASISMHSFDPVIYYKMMGSGHPPDLLSILALKPEMPVKVNVVLGPENTADKGADLLRTIHRLEALGIRRINLREPYGQPHIGDPLKARGFKTIGEVVGMPIYCPFDIAHVTYWDVHYVEVESVNLYANGRVSETYPITKGHDDSGVVLDQGNFATAGRVREQWL